MLYNVKMKKQYNYKKDCTNDVVCIGTDGYSISKLLKNPGTQSCDDKFDSQETLKLWIYTKLTAVYYELTNEQTKTQLCCRKIDTYQAWSVSSVKF